MTDYDALRIVIDAATEQWAQNTSNVELKEALRVADAVLLMYGEILMEFRKLRQNEEI